VTYLLTHAIAQVHISKKDELA